MFKIKLPWKSHEYHVALITMLGKVAMHVASVQVKAKNPGVRDGT